MKSATKRGARSASKGTKIKANSLATFDKDNRPAHSHSKKRSVVANQPGERFSNTLKTRDIAHVLRHTRTRSTDGLHIRDENDRVQGLEVKPEKLSVAIRLFAKHAESEENMPDNEDRQEPEDEDKNHNEGGI